MRASNRPVPRKPRAPRAGYRLPREQLAWHRAWQEALDRVQDRGKAETIDEGVALFLLDLATRGRQVHTTCRDAAASLRGFIRWLEAAGVCVLENLDRRHVVTYLRVIGDQGLSRHYLKQIRSNLRQLAHFLFREGLVAVDLVEGLRLRSPIPPGRPARVLTRDELEALLRAPGRWADHYPGKAPTYARWIAVRDEAVIALLAATGLRSCEAADLALADIDWDRGHGIVHGKGNHLFIKPERIVFLDVPRLAAALEAWLAIRPSTASDRLFTSSAGQAMLPQNLWRIVTKYARIAGLGEDLTPHTLRHTCCTTLIRAGVDPYTVQMLMGHRSVVHTLRWYTHLSSADLHDDWRACHPLAAEAR